MPVVLGGLLAGFGAIIVAMVAYGMHAGARGWLKPFIDALPVRHSLLYKIYRVTPIPVAVAATSWLFHKTTKAMGDALGLSLTPLVHWLTAAGSYVGLATEAQMKFAGQVAATMLHFRHKTMPAVAKHEVAPVKAAATHAGALAGHALGRARAEEKARRRSISFWSNKWIIPLGLAFAGLDAFIKHKLIPRVRGVERGVSHVTHDVLPRVGANAKAARTTSIRTRARVRRIEKILAGVLGGALVIRVLAKVAPWIFCRNVKRIGNVLCGLNPSRLDALLAGLLAVLALTNLRRTAQLAEDALDTVTGLVWDAAEIGDRPAGRFTVE